MKKLTRQELVLLYWRVRTPVRILWFVLPSLIFWFSQGYHLPWRDWPLAFVSGALLWTLSEYLLHRFVFHWLPQKTRRAPLEKMHIYHHRVPFDPFVINASFVPFVFWSLLLTGIVAGLARNWPATALTMFFLTGTYYVYEWIHHLTHFFKFDRGYLALMQRHHLDHHRHWGTNFGQSVPLWDWVFHTHRAVKPAPSELQKYIFTDEKLRELSRQ